MGATHKEGKEYAAGGGIAFTHRFPYRPEIVDHLAWVQDLGNPLLYPLSYRATDMNFPLSCDTSVRVCH
jgi:hypothetical protein